jgi:hypothetical protein
VGPQGAAVTERNGKEWDWDKRQVNRNIGAAIKLVKKSKLKMVEVRLYGEDTHYQWQGKKKV